MHVRGFVARDAPLYALVERGEERVVAARHVRRRVRCRFLPYHAMSRIHDVA
jgi:hypothetical protein